jgi:hypothetical protein
MALLMGMLNKLALASALLVAGFAHKASATPQWQNSTPIQNGAACGPATATQIGYLVDPGISPRTGDVSYIHAVAQAGCAIDTVGFDFFLPATAIPAVTADTPVYCFRNGVALATNSTGACSQQVTTGNYGGLFYGWSNLKPGELFEIQIPVHWTSATPGQIEAVLTSAISPLTPVFTPSVTYRPAVKNQTGASSSDGSSANVTFELDHFYVTSQVVVEYGTGVFDHATPPVTADAQYEDYPNVNANLPGTTPGTLLTWRVRVSNQYGTFYGDTQTVALKSNLIISPPPVCKTRFCNPLVHP